MWVAHAPGMSGTFYLPPWKVKPLVSDPCMHHGTCMAHVPARAWRRDACRDRYPAVVGKTFPAFPAHAQPAIYVSGKRPIDDRHRASYVIMTITDGCPHAVKGDMPTVRYRHNVTLFNSFVLNVNCTRVTSNRIQLWCFYVSWNGGWVDHPRITSFRQTSEWFACHAATLTSIWLKMWPKCEDLCKDTIHSRER